MCFRKVSTDCEVLRADIWTTSLTIPRIYSAHDTSVVSSPQTPPSLSVMASPNDTLSSKRRLGRRRLPPLEQGPALQFVVANHPDQFRTGKTMRHVRSHVMYKHRTDRKTTNGRANVTLQRSASARPSTASSPVMTGSDTPLGDIDCLAPPQSRPRSSTWTGGPHQYTFHAPSSSTLRALIHHILSSSQGTYAQSAPPVFEDASAYPFPSLYGAHSDPIHTLKQQYVDSCAILREGLSLG